MPGRKANDNVEALEERQVFVKDMMVLCEDVKESMDPEGKLKKLMTSLKSLCIRMGLNKIARAHPLNNMLRKISIKYGSSVLGFYNLAYWSVNMNLFCFIFWFVWVILPWFKYWEGEGWEDGNNSTVIKWDEIVLNFLGANDGNRTTDKSWFFYSGYPKKFDDYEMGLIYVVLCICTYAGALLALTLTIGGQLKDDVVPIGDMKLPVTVFAWDWQVSDKQAVHEKLLGAWVAIQAEYFSAMRRADFFTGQKVRVRRNAGSPWLDGGVISDINHKQYEVLLKKNEEGKEETLTQVEEADLEAELICGQRPATVRMVTGFTISFLLCIGSLIALYASVNYKDSMDKSFPYTSSMVVKAINILIPQLQRKIVGLEKIKDPSVVIQQEVLRVFVIKMCGVIFLFISIKEIEASAENDTCPEFLIGVMFEQLIIIDAFVDVMITIVQTLLKKKSGTRIEFKVSTEIINTLYRQCLTWIGTPYCPMLPFMSGVCMAIVFVVKAKCMFAVCKTPSQPVSDEGDGGVYQILLLVSLCVAYVPFFSFLRTKKEYCGPHWDESCTEATHDECETPLTSLNLFIERMKLTNVTNWMFSAVVLFVLCVLLLVIIYFLTVSLLSSRVKGRKRAHELDTEIKHLQFMVKNSKGIDDRPRSPDCLTDTEYHSLLATVAPDISTSVAESLRPVINALELRKRAMKQLQPVLPGSMPDKE